jgi:hypothetical protein
MTISAEQDALASLAAKRVYRQRRTPHRKTKALFRSIDMVKLKATYVAVVPADHASPTGLGNQRLPHAPAAPEQRLASASTAPEVAIPAEGELRLTMKLAKTELTG